MISLIVAMDGNGLIGKDGRLPWSIKSEMQHFTKMTTGAICIFGRNTWDTLPLKPLPDRVNMVISDGMYPRIEPLIFSSLDDALMTCRSHFPKKEIFICGGAHLYRSALPFADRVYLSWVFGDNYKGDTYFPCKPNELLYNNGFTITEERGHHIFDAGQSWDFYLLERHVRQL